MCIYICCIYIIYIIYINILYIYIYIYIYILYRCNSLNEKNKQGIKDQKVNLTLCTQAILEVYKTCSNINQL